MTGTPTEAGVPLLSSVVGRLPLADGSSPALRVTISGNRPRCGYVRCLTTQALWERIVSSH